MSIAKKQRTGLPTIHHPIDRGSESLSCWENCLPDTLGIIGGFSDLQTRIALSGVCTTWRTSLQKCQHSWNHRLLIQIRQNDFKEDVGCFKIYLCYLGSSIARKEGLCIFAHLENFDEMLIWIGRLLSVPIFLKLDLQTDYVGIIECLKLMNLTRLRTLRLTTSHYSLNKILEFFQQHGGSKIQGIHNLKITTNLFPYDPDGILSKFVFYLFFLI